MLFYFHANKVTLNVLLFKCHVERESCQSVMIFMIMSFEAFFESILLQ